MAEFKMVLSDVEEMAYKYLSIQTKLQEVVTKLSDCDAKLVASFLAGSTYDFILKNGDIARYGIKTEQFLSVSSIMCEFITSARTEIIDMDKVIAKEVFNSMMKSDEISDSDKQYIEENQEKVSTAVYDSVKETNAAQ